MAKLLNELMRKELEKKLGKVDGGVIITYQGLNSEKTTQLRASLHKKGAKLHVFKNSLARKAFETLGYKQDAIAKLISGPVGVVYAREKSVGPVGAAKAVLEWKRENPKDEAVKVRGGFLTGSVIDADGVKALSDMPSREQLLAILAGTLKAPQQSLATALNETLSKIAYAIEQVRQKKEKAGA